MRTLAAIMFTDIAGYTALMQKDEHEALAIRSAHRKHFNELTEKHEGKILQYYGDGTLSIFNSAQQAVQCGIELQKAFRKDHPIPVRIGIHLGEIVFDEEEIIGDAVNVASRIESLAKVGSVLISEKIFEEIRNKKNFNVKSLGTFQFKNVTNPIEVYAVVDQGIYVPGRQELRGKLESRQKFYELPGYPNAFIGRLHHLHSIKALLQEDTTRLVTLLGPGGMGKTRLSVKIGEILAESFENGVCFVPLDVVTDHEQVPLYIGNRLGLKESFGNSWIEEIVNFLSDKHLLLILDNLEQVLQSAYDIARILKSCPRVKILATSRENLGLSHEIEYHLDSLNRPNPNLVPDLENLLKFDAIDLFVQKARASVPNFQLTSENAAAVVKICDILDGLPLPIELAAARLKLFSPELIHKKLETDTNILKSKARDVAVRHQTIRNTVKWSYDLLDEAEQQLFQQLALFRSGFTPESLEAVCPLVDAIEVVESFMNKSLIVKDKEIYLVPRFRMLKLIRDYGLEQLEKNPAKEKIYDAFASYYGAFTEKSTSKLRSSEQAKWIALMEAEYENLSVALEWLTSNHPESAAKMGAEFWKFHLNRGFLREGLVMIERLLPLPIQSKLIHARLLEGAGVIAQNLGHYAQAKDYQKQCLDICEALQDKAEIAKALNNVGWAEWRIGNYEQTIAYAEKALAIFLELNDHLGRAKSLNNMAWAYFYKGLYEKSKDIQQEVLTIHTQINNQKGIAFAKVNLGWSMIYSDNIHEAEQLINEGSRTFKRLKNQQLVAFSLIVKAEYYHKTQEFVLARELLSNYCLPDFEKIGDSWGIATCHNRLGRIDLETKKLEEAAAHFEKALYLFRNSNDKFGEAETCMWKAKLHMVKDDFSKVNHLLDHTITLAANIEAIELLKEGHFLKAIYTEQKDAVGSAIKFLTIADYYAQKQGTDVYQKFQLQSKKLQEKLKDSLKSLKHDSTPGFSIQWEKNSLPIPREELRRRMQMLMENDESSLLDKPLTHNLLAAHGFEAPSNKEEDPFVRQVRKVIEQHLQEHEFSIQDLCREVGISHSQLHRKLRHLTNSSTTKFIRSIRMEKAKALLLDPKLTVAAVAYDTGFKDPDYFHRVFKQTFDMTPTEYRHAQVNRMERE